MKAGKTKDSAANTTTQDDTIPEWKFEPTSTPKPSTVYHVAVNGQATGPYNIETLRQWAASDQFHANSLVWTKGMENWEKAGNISELKSIFEDKPPVSPIEHRSTINAPIKAKRTIEKAKRIIKKTRVCKNCNTPLKKNMLFCPECGTKKEDPFYKKRWFTQSIVIASVIIVLLVAISSITPTKKHQKDTFTWTNVGLYKHLPEPESNVGYITTNENEMLLGEVDELSKEDYNNYVDKCMSMGYTIDAENMGDSFTALNNENYKLSLRYYSDTMHIELEALEQLETLIWPKSKIANLLPIPPSTVGKVSDDSANGCLIYVGETPIENFNAYIDECMKKGFAVDYVRDDKEYHANDENDNQLSLTYRGNNVMVIDIDKSDDDDEDYDESAVETDMNENESSDDAGTSTDAIRPKFKKAMDSYEAFIDNYCEFMKKYAESDGTDIGLLADYLDFISKIADVTKDFEAWNDKDLNTAEVAYYLEVQTRANKKLMSIKN